MNYNYKLRSAYFSSSLCLLACKPRSSTYYHLSAAYFVFPSP